MKAYNFSSRAVVSATKAYLPPAIVGGTPFAQLCCDCEVLSASQSEEQKRNSG